MSAETAHRLDGFDPDEALTELRSIASVILGDDRQSGEGTLAEFAGRWALMSGRMAVLFDLLDHWLITGNDPPAQWQGAG